MRSFLLLGLVAILYSGQPGQARVAVNLTHQNHRHPADGTSPPSNWGRARSERAPHLCTDAVTFKIEDGGGSTQTLSSAELHAVVESTDPKILPHLRVRVEGLPCARHGCCDHALLIRPKTSDILVLMTAINEYRNFLTKIQPHFEFKTILDAGGNVGIASMVFANLFPDAVIYALEPQEQNCLLLKANTLAFPNVRVHCKGLWDKVAKVAVKSGSLDWGWYLQEVGEEDPTASPTTTVAQLIVDHGLHGFDFVKVDIEGAEFKVFGPEADLSWMNTSQLIALEVHDWSGNRNELTQSIVGKGFLQSSSGEYSVFAVESLHTKLTSRHLH